MPLKKRHRKGGADWGRIYWVIRLILELFKFLIWILWMWLRGILEGLL